MAYSWHKVVPFVGELDPVPVIENQNAVVLFGSYTLWRYAEGEGLNPGVFKVRPFVHAPPFRQLHTPKRKTHIKGIVFNTSNEDTPHPCPEFFGSKTMSLRHFAVCRTQFLPKADEVLEEPKTLSRGI